MLVPALMLFMHYKNVLTLTDDSGMRARAAEGAVWSADGMGGAIEGDGHRWEGTAH